MSNLLEHADRELRIAGFSPDAADGPDRWLYENVMELLKVFAGQGHSGFSATYSAGVFGTLAGFKPLSPIRGTEDEWVDVSEQCGETMYQNQRCSRIFKDGTGQAYDVEGRVFREPDGNCYTNGDSRVPVTFPYTPRTIYVNVASGKED